MPGLSKVIVLDPDLRAGRQLQLGFEREGIPAAAAVVVDGTSLPPPDPETGLVVVGGVDGQGVDLVRRARGWLDGERIDAPIVFAGRGVAPEDATAAGADEALRQPAYLRDVVTIGRLLLGAPSGHRSHIVGSLIDVTGVFTLVRALAALGRSATLTLVRGLRRGEVRFYRGEVTSAQVGLSHGQAALHQLLLWTDARFDFHHGELVRRQQIPLSPDELFADAERFLESVRASSGGLSPAMVLEQDIPRVQSLSKQIPTEVYGVLRMFDGHRALADVLEDSAYRVFETLRVAQRAVEAGLLRVVAHPPPRPGWRVILGIENWLVGGERAPAPAPAPAARPTPEPADKAGSKRRKKKRRSDTPVALPARPGAARDIDWGALVPRTVGAEVGPLAGVVPASHVSGEIVSARGASGGSDGAGADGRAALAVGDDEPTVVFDEGAGDEPEAAEDDAAEDDAAEDDAAEDDAAEDDAERAAEAARAAAEADAEARARAIRVVAETVSVSSEPAPVVGDADLADTKPERRGPGGRTTATTGVEPAQAQAQAEAAAVQDAVDAASDAVTAPIAAVEPAGAAAPDEVADEPSDGVVRDRIATAETAPVKRRPPGELPIDDRPAETTGEITMPQARPGVEVRPSEPSILVADLAEVHAAVSAVAAEQAAAPATADAAAPSLEVSVAEVRRDAEVFSDDDEAFFSGGHTDSGPVAVPAAESFRDLDEGYRPRGFWQRLRRRLPTQPEEPEARGAREAPSAAPGVPDKPDKPDNS